MLPLIAIDFPQFTDGRGYSTARLLRERHRYAGELRAVGDVLRDQLYLLAECGFDAFGGARRPRRHRRASRASPTSAALRADGADAAARVSGVARYNFRGAGPQPATTDATAAVRSFSSAQQDWLARVLARPAPASAQNLSDGFRLPGREGEPTPAAVLVPLVNRPADSTCC